LIDELSFDGVSRNSKSSIKIYYASLEHNIYITYSLM
jgi:hypothetical protein